MPAFNAGPYIRESIESVLAQTYTDFEYLIIDDGSQDETASILESFKDTRIRIIRHENNRGLIATLNEGIMEAKGSIIARMDADDVCLPGRLAHQLEILRENPEYVLVGSEAEAIDKDGNFLMPLIPLPTLMRRSWNESMGEYRSFILV